MGPRRAHYNGVLEPEELPLLQHEPAAPPHLDVLALLRELAGEVRVRLELNDVVVHCRFLR